ncbi:MAG TPA: cytochrome c oxidase assembly protein [Acidimicrobiia bacterium]|nr:cytochrome c oxidase assembly protein [Acidimicrobiia bacterium]
MNAVAFPAWEAHPDVWLLVGVLAAAYAVAIVRLGPVHATAGVPVVSRFQVVCFASGVAALFVGSSWPVHDLGEQYLFSVHMLQHLVYSLIAAPLLLLGTPTWLARWLLRPQWLLTTVRFLTRFFVATLLFNLVVIVTHVPAVVNAALESGLVHFGVHALVLVSALIVWMPLASPLPEVPRYQPLLAMLFLFMQSVVPTVPASFLTFGDRPLYRFYEQVPRLYDISALDDMRIAGLVMKIGAGTLLWIVIAIVFFRWYGEEEARPRRRSHDLDRELQGLTAR